MRKTRAARLTLVVSSTNASLFRPKVQNRVFAVAASYGPDDAGPVRRSAETCFGVFLDFISLGCAEAAKVVAAERPQIFIDLMAHTFGAR